MPAKSIGSREFLVLSPFFLAYSSLVDLTICLSLTRLSNPSPLSTTRNQVPFPVSPAPAAFSASINKGLAPCVTAVLNKAMLSFCLRCPVKSVN